VLTVIFYNAYHDDFDAWFLTKREAIKNAKDYNREAELRPNEQGAEVWRVDIGKPTRERIRAILEHGTFADQREKVWP